MSARHAVWFSSFPATPWTRGPFALPANKSCKSLNTNPLQSRRLLKQPGCPNHQTKSGSAARKTAQRKLSHGNGTAAQSRFRKGKANANSQPCSSFAPCCSAVWPHGTFGLNSTGHLPQTNLQSTLNPSPHRHQRKQRKQRPTRLIRTPDFSK